MFFPSELEEAKNLSDIFEIVKCAVEKVLGSHRAGLTLGLADLGEGVYGWIGGYHIISSNSIIMNLRPLERIKEYKPELYKSYVFMVLTHEYIHSLGVINESKCRELTLCVTETLFGHHLVTDMARDIRRFIPQFRAAKYGWVPPQDPKIYYVENFDRSSMTYYS